MKKELIVGFQHFMAEGPEQEFRLKVLGRMGLTSRLTYKPDVFRFQLVSEPVAVLSELARGASASFEECCERRALQLENAIEKQNCPLYLMWSGGIDSTCALVSIWKFFKPETLSRVRILLTKASVGEYPWLFKNVVAPGFTMLPSNQNLERLLRDGVVVTGELGDQIFGSDWVKKALDLFGPGAHRKPYRDVVPRLFETVAGEADRHGMFERLEPIAGEAPFPIVTTFDFLWWLNFSQKWQHVKFRQMIFYRFKNPRAAAERTFHFFDTPDFQVWSLRNHDRKIGDDWISYKEPAKRFIVRHTGDADYMSKIKVGSLIGVVRQNPLNHGVNREWANVESQEIGEYYA